MRPEIAALIILALALWILLANLLKQAEVVEAMPGLSDAERKMVVNDLRGLAEDVGYSEPEVGVFGDDTLAAYITEIASRVERGVL